MAALRVEDLSKSELKNFCDSGFIPCTSSGVLLDQDQDGYARTPEYGTPRIYDDDGTIPQNNHTPMYNHGTPGGTPSYGTPNHYGTPNYGGTPGRQTPNEYGTPNYGGTPGRQTPNEYGTSNYGGTPGRQTPIGYDRPRPERRSTIGTPHYKPGSSRTPERPGRTSDYSSNDYNYPRSGTLRISKDLKNRQKNEDKMEE